MAGLTLDDVPAARLAERWGAPQAGLFRSLPSVLDAVHDLAAQDAPAGTLVLAVEQTAGRGRDGRTWRSPAGGVWLGLLLRPGDGALGSTPIRAALAVADAVDGLVGRPAARLKWPNDVLLLDRKVAGILCEARWHGTAVRWLAVGVGVNLANDIPAELAERAVAVREVRSGVRRIDLLDRLVPDLLRRTADGGPLTERERAAFAARDWLRGRLLRRPVFGRAAGVGPDGALLVDADAGAVTVRAGHVELA
ncbi:MAG: biotin--[acetyl-CoA-carboxylase] ligase [Gemmatimonadales bacterium]